MKDHIGAEAAMTPSTEFGYLIRNHAPIIPPYEPPNPTTAALARAGSLCFSCAAEAAGQRRGGPLQWVGGGVMLVVVVVVVLWCVCVCLVGGGRRT